MFFLGDFLGDIFALADTPTNAENSNSLSLENGFYDEIYVGTDEDLDKSDDTMPEGFGSPTIMHSPFNDSANAGNVDWSTYDIDCLTIQRRKLGTDNWVVIEARQVTNSGDFAFSGVDITAAAATDYEYAVVPYSKGYSGEYSSEFIRSDFSGIYIVDNDAIYGTPITDGHINTTRNIQRSFNTLLNRRFPVACSNSVVNYDTGSCTATWLHFNEQNCQFEIEDNLRVPYQLNFMNWLTDGKAKILKSEDGRIWLIEINSNPSDNARDQYNIREVTFDWTEIGDANNELDLWYAGFIKAEHYWWGGYVR